MTERTVEPAGESPAAQRFGDYDLLQELGHGGMGVVFLARQRTADRMVALKLIRRDYLAQLSDKWRDEMMQRFRTEVRAAASVDHEHIVTVYEVGEVEGQPFFSMQYVPGTSLREILAKGPLENRVAAKYLMPVARAIHSAHQQGVLHRDLKPGNLLIDSRSDRALVADFGLAKLLEADTEVTKAGVTLGSPPYMSPEQARDASHVTRAADVYSLGATLYHMLTGRPPLQAATVAETLCQVLQREPALPHELNAAVDRDLEAVCMKCLEKEPARRYASADELADELERYLNGQPVRARPIGHVGRLWRWCRNNRLTASLVLAFITILAIAAVVATTGFILASLVLRREARQLQLTEQNFRLARQAVERNVDLVTEEPLMKSRGLERLRARN